MNNMMDSEASKRIAELEDHVLSLRNRLEFQRPIYIWLYPDDDRATSGRQRVEWVSMEERPPETDGEYLVVESTPSGMFISLGKWENGEWQLSWFPARIDVTHWMPLPALPENDHTQ